jgi:hypothetical protein
MRFAQELLPRAERLVPVAKATPQKPVILNEARRETSFLGRGFARAQLKDL